MKKVLLGVAAGLFFIPSALLADTISPTSVTGTLAVGESATIHKTVTVTSEPSTSSMVDVFFLADTTGSMYGSIAAVAAGASSIMTSTASLGNVAYAVGEYKDFGYGDPYAYRLNTAMTTSTSAVQDGIDMWTASGGADWEEANLYALTEASKAASGWRDGSTRIMVWFGDAPGHDPSGGATLASTTAALNAANIDVAAVDVGNMDYYGQASAIATATGGAYYAGIDAGSIVDTITDAIETIVNEYTSVALDLSAVPDGLTVTATPSGYSGTWDRTVARNFSFDVVITGDEVGDYGFDIYALVDGARVAVESDRFTVSGVPEPSTILLFSAGLLGLTGLGRRRVVRN